MPGHASGQMTMSSPEEMTVQTEPTDHQDLLDRFRSQRGFATLLSVAALSFGGVGLAACGEDEPVEEVATEETPEVVEEPAEEDADVEQTTLPRLLSNPEDFVGQTVDVAGAVIDEEVDGESNTGAAFTIGEVLDEDLLILPQSESDLTPEGIVEESVVTVRGTVVEVTQNVAEEEDFLFEEEGMDDAFLDEFEGEYAIAATEIQVSDQLEQDDDTQ